MVGLDSLGGFDIGTSVCEEIVPHEGLVVTPNPVTSATVVTFDLQAPSHIRIEFVSIMGLVTNVVYDGCADAGSHSLLHDASNLAAGMYLLRMTRAEQVVTASVMVTH